MPRNVYRNTSERKETARAQQAFCDFRDMGPTRSLPKLLEKYRVSTVKAGEFVLGYVDEWERPAPMPQPDVLGRNGSYGERSPQV